MGFPQRAWKALNSPITMPKLSGANLRGLLGIGGSDRNAVLPPTQGRPSQGAGGGMEFGAAAAWDAKYCLEQGMSWSSTGATCMDFRAKSVASLQWVVEEWVGPSDDDWKAIPQHPFINRLEQPLPDQPFINGSNLIYRTVQHLDLTGKACWYMILVSDKKEPISELWWLQPDKIKPVKSDTDFITAFCYTPKMGGQGKNYNLQQICYFHNPHPARPFDGLSMLERGAGALDTDRALNSFIWSSLHNRAIKDGILAVKQQLTPERRAEINQSINQQVTGLGNARGIIVVDCEATFHPASLTPAEVDFRESNKDSVEKVCSVFGVLPPCIGYFDQATMNNVDSAHFMTWVNTLVPLAGDVAKAISSQILMRHYKTSAKQKLRLVPDLSKVPALVKMLDIKADTAKKYWGMGVSFEAINREMQIGFDCSEIEGSDKGYLPGGLTPVDQVGQTNMDPFADFQNPNSPFAAKPPAEDPPKEIAPDGKPDQEKRFSLNGRH